MRQAASRRVFALLFILLSAFLAQGCASKLKTRAGTAVNTPTYNDEMKEQGLDYYCFGGRCDQPPRLIEGAAPIYPRDALANRLRGEAKIAFYIESDGTTGRLELVSATAPEFGEAAITAIRRWKFEPARKFGLPVEIRVAQVFPFTP